MNDGAGRNGPGAPIGSGGASNPGRPALQRVNTPYPNTATPISTSSEGGVPQVSQEIRAIRMSGEVRSSAGKYRDIAELGSGGMGEVSLCVSSGIGGFNKLLVVKRLRGHLAEDSEIIAMFMKEARLAARLNHPNVVQTYEVGVDARGPFMAMEYLDGQSLLSLIRKAKESGGIPVAVHLRILSDVLAGLHYAHELADFDGRPLGIVHRDVTPHNVFVTYDGVAKLVDFGIAKVKHGTDSGVEETRTGVLKGKIPYMAPEQVDGAARAERRSDIFAVGVMLWEAAVRSRLWKGKTDLQIMYHLHRGEIPTPRSVNPDVPEILEAIIMRSLAHRPEDRYQTAAEQQADLESFLDAPPHRAGSREISKYVTGLFAETRAAIRGVIDQQLKLVAQAEENPDAGPPPTVPLRPLEGRVQTFPPGEDPGSRVGLAAPAQASVPPKGPSPWVIGLGAAGAIAIAAAAFVLISRGSGAGASGDRRGDDDKKAAVADDHEKTKGKGKDDDSDDEPSQAPSSATNTLPSTIDSAIAIAQPAVSAIETTPPAEKTQLVVETTPKDAKLVLDGAPIDAAGPFMRDGVKHRLEVSAPGYATKIEWVLFDRDEVDLKVALSPIAIVAIKPNPVPTTKPSAVTTATTDTASTTPSGKKPTNKPSLDKDDPWK